LSVLLAGCGSSAPTAPSTPAPARLTLSGVVSGAGVGPLGGARVEVVSGVNLGQSATADAAGRYTLVDLVPGAMTLRASAAGYVPQTSTVTPSASQTVDFSLAVAAFVTNGRAIDALSQAGVGSVAVGGADIASTASDATGAFSVMASTTSTDPRLVILTGPTIVERRTNLRVPGADVLVSLIATSFDLRAFDEMFRVSQLLRWTTAPPLVVETRAVQFTTVSMVEGTAVADEMSASEQDGLVADLTWTLPQLTGGTFGGFATVTRQTANEGATIRLLNTGVITVCRVVGLTQLAGYWGYSRWQFRSDGTVTGGLVMLDRDFERSGSAFLRSLRAHELGHALGYNHVTVRPSVMNSSARIEPNAFDLESARIAFQRPPGNRSPDTDPSAASLNFISPTLTWSPPIR
jgi:hypothetical protein